MSHEKTENRQITLTIDGRQATAWPLTTILEAARSIGVFIPTLCYHARLTPIGSCRVCLVKVEGQTDPVASCATAVSQGMVVTTDDDELRRLRRQAIQFLLLNHPLECPVCDKAGECELQDITYKLDVHSQDYAMSPVTWQNDIKSPLIFRSDGRCIRCGRCVAICHEVQNAAAIDFVKRGYDAHIAPANGDVLDCEFCGQCVSVCPVGALLPKPFLNRIRVWDVQGTPTVCAFCGAGCAVSAHTRTDTLYRVVSNREGTHNRGDLCVRGTFGFQFVESEKRLASARVKGNGEAVQTDTAQAIEQAATRFKKIADAHGPQAVAGIGSARMPNEDALAFAQFMHKVVRSPHLDTEAGLGYRQLHTAMFGGPVGAFDDLETSDAILVLGSDLGVEMPVPALRVVAAAKQHDARIVAAAPYSTKLHAISRVPITYAPGSEAALAQVLAKIAIEKGLLPKSWQGTPQVAQIEKGLTTSVEDLCARAGVSVAQATAAAQAFFAGSRRTVIVGPYGYRDETSREAIALLAWLADPAVFILSAERANMQGVTDVGCAPGPEGLDYRQILDGIQAGTIKALWVAGSDPVALFKNREDALAKLELLVVQDAFLSGTAKLAHVVLPVASWGQKSGTTTSAEGRVQQLGQSLPCPDGLYTDARVFALAAKAYGASLQADRAALGRLIRQTVDGYAQTAGWADGEGTFAATPKKLAPPRPPQALEPKASNGFWLVRSACLYMNGTLGTHCRHLRALCPQAYLALAPQTMESLGVSEGQKVSVTTAAGALEIATKKDAHIPAGVGTIIDHFSESGVSALFENVADCAAATLKKAGE